MGTENTSKGSVATYGAVAVVGALAFAGGRVTAQSNTPKVTPDRPAASAGGQAKAPTPPEPPAPEPAPPPPPPEEAATLAEAIALFSDRWEDTFKEDDKATGRFAILWEKERYPWAQLQAVADTSYGKVMKDSDKERGKRMCVSGSVVQIRTATKSKEIYEGVLQTSDFRPISFFAVGSTGELVERSAARFCGIVTGKHSYQNVRAGTTHSVQMVGVFDLPENRGKPKSAAE